MPEYRKFTDFELLEQIRTIEDPGEAIQFLYRSHFELTKTYIGQNNGSEQDAEDIFQEVILTFIDIVRRDKFRGESSITTFLYALGRNIWLNELKKRGRAQLRNQKFEKGKDGADLDVSHYIAQREMRAELFSILEKLGETCKKILLAVYFENLAMKEILRTLQYENEQVVRNKKYKCLKTLEKMITDQPALAKNLKSVLSYE